MLIVPVLAGLAWATSYAAGVLAAPPALRDGQVEATYVPDARFLRVASLGHQAAVADFLWFRAFNYFGAHYRSDRLYPWLAKICDVVTDLDPKALHVYKFVGVVLPWEADQVDEGIALLHKGIGHLPDSWYLHWLLGFNYYYFKGDLPRAAQYLRRAAELPGTHPYVSRLAAIIYAEGVSPRAAESFLRDLAASAPDEATRSVITQRLGEMQLARDLDALDAAVARYREVHDEFPPSLASLVAAGYLAALPEEPFGGHYKLDAATGKVTTDSGHVPLRLHSSKLREERLKSASE